MSFTLVLVGSGDAGRTVLAKAILDRELRRLHPGAAGPVLIRTAGVDALPGMPPAHHVATVAARRGLAVQDHTATAMTRALAESADLLLTMTRRQRAQLVLQHPALRARTFSLVEFAALLHDVAAAPAGVRAGGGLDVLLHALVPAVAARARVVAPPTDEGGWDLPDPYAQGLDRYEAVADEMEALVHAVVTDVWTLLAGRSAMRSA